MAELNLPAFMRHLERVSGLDEIGGRLLVVFDGNCGFCNGWVRWLLRRDRRDRLRFAPSSSPAVAPLLARHAELLEPGGVPGTVLVFRNPLEPKEQPLTRFAATLALLAELPPPWPAVAAAMGWIPGFLSDPLYRLVARWRYRIRGRLESCPIPTPEEQARFL
ncbi:MAG: DCC1-like thiol-disulfide oxidoreductase family protein [Terracidiphilus sp.]